MAQMRCLIFASNLVIPQTRGKPNYSLVSIMEFFWWNLKWILDGVCGVLSPKRELEGKGGQLLYELKELLRT